MTWSEFTKEIDRQLKEMGLEPNTKISSIHVDCTLSSDIEIYCDPVLGLEIT